MAMGRLEKTTPGGWVASCAAFRSYFCSAFFVLLFPFFLFSFASFYIVGFFGRVFRLRGVGLGTMGSTIVG